jgi:hypothetical protein
MIQVGAAFVPALQAGIGLQLVAATPGFDDDIANDHKDRNADRGFFSNSIP